MATPEGWKGILDDGEEIMWQGRPDGAIVWRMAYAFSIVFGLMFSGFALFWMIMAAQSGGPFWMFGLLHFFAGIGIALGPPFWGAWRRRHTWYTLTDRRAFIATDMPIRGRDLKSYPIDDDTLVEVDNGNPGSIYFATERKRRQKGYQDVKVGFERIGDWERPYHLIRGMQRRENAE